MEPAGTSDREFVATLMDAIGRFFAAVDRWESIHHRYHRLPGEQWKPGSDLLAEQVGKLASYLLIDGATFSVRRVEHDVEREIKALG
jgi:hypothetical protein